MVNNAGSSSGRRRATGRGRGRSVAAVDQAVVAADVGSNLEQQIQAKVEQAEGFIAMVQEFVDGEVFAGAKSYEVKTQVELLDMGFKELRELGRGAEYARKYMDLKNKLNMKNQESEPQGAFSGNVTVQSKVDLPKFSGDFAKWQDFEAEFVIDVHEKKISDPEKLRKLKSCLSGRPLDMISKYDLRTTGAYQQAWEELKSHYNNSAEAFAKHVSLIFKHENMKQGDSEGVRSLIGIVEANVCKAKQIMNGRDELGHAAAVHLIELMDPTTREQWRLNRLDADVVPTLPEVAKFCLAKTKTWDEGRGKVVPSHTATGFERSFRDSRQGPSSSKTPRFSCYRCKGNHYLRECSEFKADSLTRREQFMQDNRLCRKCFGRHGRDPCRWTEKLCGKCEDPHHVIMCPK